MDEPNPYEAPKVNLAVAGHRPVTKIELLVATRMLVVHENGGYSLGQFLKWSAARYLVLVIFFGGVLVVAGLAELWVPFALVAGLFAGTLLRDMGWYRASARVWPYTDRVTDWEKVRAIAAGDDV